MTDGPSINSLCVCMNDGGGEHHRQHYVLCNGCWSNTAIFNSDKVCTVNGIASSHRKTLLVVERVLGVKCWNHCIIHFMRENCNQKRSCFAFIYPCTNGV